MAPISRPIVPRAPIHRTDRRVETWAIVLALASVGVIAASLLARLVSPTAPVWDDAYMFFRYATNLAEEGRVAWNPGGDPTWGATSLVYVVLVLAARALGTSDPLRALLGTSLACGLALVGLLVGLARSASSGVLTRAAAVAIVCFVVGFQARPLSAHFLSGMDTTFAACWLAVYLLLAYRHRRHGSTSSGVGVGVLGGLTFFVRPELLVFSLAVPAGIVALARSGHERRNGLLMAGTTLAVALGGMLLAASYFGAPLPLSFYVKAAGVHGETMRRMYAGVGVREWLVFARSNAPCLAAAAFAGLHWWRTGRGSDVSIEAGLVAGLLVHGAFQAFCVTPIMFYEQRFHYPVLPALVALACRGWVDLRAGHERLARIVLVAALLLLAWPATVRSMEIGRGLRDTGGGTAPLTLQDSYRSQADVWLGLDRLRSLPDDLVIATTEVGHPGAMCPRKTILDLAGLNDPHLARGGVSSGRIFDRPPDWIYLPHEDYRELVDALKGSPSFRSRYDVYPRDLLGVAQVRVGNRVETRPYFLEVAVLRGGPHEAACRAVLASTAHAR